MPIIIPPADIAHLEKLSWETSPELFAAIQSPDWISCAGLPPAPNPWSAARHWLEKPWDTDEPNEQRPPYFAKLLNYLRQPIPLDDFAVCLARLYLRNVGVSLGWRTAVVQVLEGVVETRLAELGYREMAGAVAGLVADRVPGWQTQVLSGQPTGDPFEFECLLGFFREVWNCEVDGLAVAHAAHQWFQLCFHDSRHVWRDYR